MKDQHPAEAPVFYVTHDGKHGEFPQADGNLSCVTDDMRSAVRWAPSSCYWSVMLLGFFGPNARDGINALQHQLRDTNATIARVRALADRLERVSENLIEPQEVAYRYAAREIRAALEGK